MVLFGEGIHSKDLWGVDPLSLNNGAKESLYVILGGGGEVDPEPWKFFSWRFNRVVKGGLEQRLLGDVRRIGFGFGQTIRLQGGGGGGMRGVKG